MLTRSLAMARVIMIANAVATLLILSIGTISNAIVIYTYFKIKSLHTINNIFLCQVAFVDMTKASLILPVKVYFQLQSSQLSNEYICQLTAFISSLTYLQSSALLALIAVVRYFKLLKPFNFEHIFIKRNVVMLSLLLAFVNATVSLFPLIGLGRCKFSIYHGICFADWSTINALYRTLFYMLTIGLNYPVLIFSYGRIFFALKKHKRLIASVANMERRDISNKQVEGKHFIVNNGALERREESLEVNDVNGEKTATLCAKNNIKRVRFCVDVKVEQDSAADIQGESQWTMREGEIGANRVKKSHRHARHKLNKEIEVTKAMFAMFIAYSFCWLPAFFVNLFKMTKLFEISPSTLFIVVTLVELKVCLNPLIYVTWSTQFRRAFKQLFYKEIRTSLMQSK